MTVKKRKARVTSYVEEAAERVLKSEALTFAQSLNLVLTAKYRRVETSFTDAEGTRFDVCIYSCKEYFRADFKPKECLSEEALKP